jgi:hypothetical protein
MAAMTPRLLDVMAGPYPADLLPDGGTGLSLFAAAYLGSNDSVHFARKNITTTCVDADREKLDLMAALYPEEWRFVATDAWAFAEQAVAAGDSWDVVSVDTFTGDASNRSVKMLDLWCGLARKLVTVTVGRLDTVDSVPDGWSHSRLFRTARASWLVLTRA